MSKSYDYCIVGGGIAGLSIAETISRYDKSVLIIEKNKQLGFEASSKHQNWFHVGSLYAILNNFKFMKFTFKNLEIIDKHYSSFLHNNLNLNNGKILFKKKGWFNKKKINYLVISRNNSFFKKFNFFTKLAKIISWELKIKKFIIRHNSLSKYDWSKNFSLINRNILNYSNKKIKKGRIKNTKYNPNTHFLLEGFDTTMNSNLIMRDLYESYVNNNGELLINNEVKSIKNKKIILKNGKIIKANKIILANSKTINEISRKNIVKTKISPIAIIKPSLNIQNFAKLSPDENDTLNHLNQTENGDNISIIADGAYCDEKDVENIKKNEELLKNKILNNIDLKNHKIHVYSSHKTEFINDSKKRNYLFNIYEINKSTISIIPGKFTFCFSLAYEFKNKYLKNESLLFTRKPKVKGVDTKIIAKNYYKRIYEKK